MLEGPYRANTWRERLANIEGVLVVLQVLAYLGVAIFTGYDWFLAGQYMRLLSVFGSAAACIALAVATRRPFLLFGLIVPFVLDLYWSGP